MPQYTIQITDHQKSPIVDHPLLETVIHRVLVDEQIPVATISVALVTDAEIHRINREFLGHDYPTDVISFLLNDPAASSIEYQLPAAVSDTSLPGTDIGSGIDGELIVSTETAMREAAAHGWSPQAELLLYIVHGLLHLCGYDDIPDDQRPLMRARERELLAIWGYCPAGLES